MNIHQLSASHDERQDRLLLRLNTQAGQEFRFWLTRRMVVRLLPAMDQSLVKLEVAQPGMVATDPPTQHMLAEFKRNAFLQSADFSTPYTQTPLALPMGQEPMLVTDVQLSLQPNGHMQMVFQNKNEGAPQTCQLNLHPPLVHGMIHLVRQAVEKAEWGILPPQPVAATVSAPDSAVPASVPYKH